MYLFDLERSPAAGTPGSETPSPAENCLIDETSRHIAHQKRALNSIEAWTRKLRVHKKHVLSGIIYPAPFIVLWKSGRMTNKHILCSSSYHFSSQCMTEQNYQTSLGQPLSPNFTQRRPSVTYRLVSHISGDCWAAGRRPATPDPDPSSDTTLSERKRYDTGRRGSPYSDVTGLSVRGSSCIWVLDGLNRSWISNPIQSRCIWTWLDYRTACSLDWTAYPVDSGSP